MTFGGTTTTTAPQPDPPEVPPSPAATSSRKLRKKRKGKGKGREPEIEGQVGHAPEPEIEPQPQPETQPQPQPQPQPEEEPVIITEEELERARREELARLAGITRPFHIDDDIPDPDDTDFGHGSIVRVRRKGKGKPRIGVVISKEGQHFSDDWSVHYFDPKKVSPSLKGLVPKGNLGEKAEPLTRDEEKRFKSIQKRWGDIYGLGKGGRQQKQYLDDEVILRDIIAPTIESAKLRDYEELSRRHSLTLFPPAQVIQTTRDRLRPVPELTPEDSYQLLIEAARVTGKPVRTAHTASANAEYRPSKHFEDKKLWVQGQGLSRIHHSVSGDERAFIHSYNPTKDAFVLQREGGYNPDIEDERRYDKVGRREIKRSVLESAMAEGEFGLFMDRQRIREEEESGPSPLARAGGAAAAGGRAAGGLALELMGGVGEAIHEQLPSPRQVARGVGRGMLGVGGAAVSVAGDVLGGGARLARRGIAEATGSAHAERLGNLPDVPEGQAETL